KLMNEIQMQLHECDINDLRASRGELPVNSVWFWGVGNVPANFIGTQTEVYTDDVFVTGLALKADMRYHPVLLDMNTIIERSSQQDSVLLVLQHCQAPAQYQNLRLWH